MTDTGEALTFEQREGAAPLPRQLQLKELSRESRAKLWAVVYEYIRPRSNALRPPWGSILRRYWVDRMHADADGFSDYPDRAVDWVKPIILDQSYEKSLGFVEHIIRHPEAPATFEMQVSQILVTCGAAYRVMDGRTITPISSPEEAIAIAEALKELTPHEAARAHLHKAAAALTAGRNADAVRESIHAVESVARKLEPSAATLGPALSALEKQGHLHPAMKQGFSSLYGYTSDEAGIRHALLDAGDANVTEAEALYMFGACAAFASYLVRRVPLPGR
jgi:hypothetical protein